MKKTKLPKMKEGPSAVKAIVCSDIHLSLSPPVYRSGEPDWLMAMNRPLNEIRRLARQNDCPVIIAGDLFDRWNAPAELINFALAKLPDNTYAIPGNHDLSYHNWGELKRTAFYTLVKAGKITLLEPEKPVETPNGIRLWGFPCGFPIKKLENPHDLVMEVAVAHDYIWTENSRYEGTWKTNAQHESLFQEKAKTYDIAIFGDNHKQFSAGKIYNCGNFMRRKSDDNPPSVGILWSDGKVEKHFLDCSDDIYGDKKDGKSKSNFTKDVIEFLSKLSESSVDFAESLKRTMNKKSVSDGVKKVIRKAMENG